MPRDTSFHDYIIDLLADMPGITSRSMFGGWGIYKDRIFFGLISDGELYFKVGAGNRAEYEKAMSRSFVYSANGKKITMSYWLVPEEVLEDRETLSEWVEKAVTEARKATKKPHHIKGGP